MSKIVCDLYLVTLQYLYRMMRETMFALDLDETWGCHSCRGQRNKHNKSIRMKQANMILPVGVQKLFVGLSSLAILNTR